MTLWLRYSLGKSHRQNWYNKIGIFVIFFHLLFCSNGFCYFFPNSPSWSMGMAELLSWLILDAFVFGHRFAHSICLQHDIIPRLVGLIVLCMGTIISQRPMQLHFLHNIIHMHGTMLRAVQIIVSDFYVPAFPPYYCISFGFSAMCVCVVSLFLIQSVTLNWCAWKIAQLSRHPNKRWNPIRTNDANLPSLRLLYIYSVYALDYSLVLPHIFGWCAMCIVRMKAK